jgi:hypothetical protein
MPDNVIRLQPNFDDIHQLTKLNIPSVIRFLNQVNEYQQKYNIPLKVGTHVSQKIIETLMAYNGYYDWNLGDFYAITSVRLVEMLQRALKPASRTVFEKYMKDYLEFKLPQSYVPTVQNFKPLYTALLTYRTDFKRLYEFMSIRKASNVPKCNMKPGGLIKLFISKIVPASFGEGVLKLLKTTNYDDINVFLDDFYKFVQQSFSAHLKAKTSAYLLSEPVSFSAAQTPAPKRFYSSDGMKQPGTRYEKRTSGLAGRLQALTSERGHNEETDDDHHHQSEASEEYEPWDQLADGYHEEEPELSYDCVYPANMDIPRTDPCTDLSATTDVSGAFNTPRSAQHQPASQSQHKSQLSTRPDVPNGCFAMLFYGECKKQQKCSYSHDTAVLRATHAHYQKILNSSPYRVPVQVLPPRPQGHNHHVNAVSSVSLLDTTMDNVIENTFLASFPGGSLVKTVVKPGTVEGSTQLVPVGSVLFDTGALHASYISGTFVNDHREQLQSSLSAYSALARLADGKTVVSITEICHIELTILDSHSKPHVQVVPLLVLPSCGTDIIIGLPQIISSFGSLFINMIDTAITSAARVPCLNALDLSSDIPTELPPWAGTDGSEGPEEDAVALPTSFGWHLHYMEMPHEEALKEYRSQFDSQICPQFRAMTDIVRLLETKGVRVFVPNNWDGINGIPPIELPWKPDLPTRMKPPARPINPKLFANAKIEFERLTKYMYTPSNSPIASPLVIAPKSTAPYIRFCGDYVFINGFIYLGNHPIPIVRHELNKIILFAYFVDVDMMNSFHQFRLSPYTSALLSIQSPWGQYQPNFLPEGVSPASFLLQEKVRELFADFSEWTICIFDNFLILAHDYDDAYRKLELFLDRCIERNLFLKFPKSFFGFDHANFFGYLCKHNSYELSQKRKDGINDIQFPRTLKLMQSFLGEALFFNSFVPNYSNLTAHLNEMTRNTGIR